ncbi:DeoR/GlpR family DNA-binding transcription regulator [Roseovarius sp. Pro17]|uniref:DeoR/GlpR family DNA-binding transcription regulator n=1 Tax=Roseovarius sp. Pro17 TaxID=3108175 RepID=UPI002D778DE1|nr:DeoR/GlpR family DNA-binding transcription regulator [Roseovarius sp. Pro17]
MALSKKDRRQDQILAALDRNPSMRVSELADALAVSSETIRRDLSHLDEAGRISRTYGGAVRGHVSEPHLAERLGQHIDARQAIARTAMTLIGNAETIFIGGGATTLHFARALRSTERRLTVLTPAFRVAAELSENANIQTMCLPGLFDGKEGMVTGPETLAAIRRYHAPIAFMGASAIDAGGVSEAMLGPSEVYRAMIENAQTAYILADQSKFDRRALRYITEWTSGIHLVTDVSPGADLLAALEAGGAEITLSGAGGRAL